MSGLLFSFFLSIRCLFFSLISCHSLFFIPKILDPKQLGKSHWKFTIFPFEKSARTALLRTGSSWKLRIGGLGARRSRNCALRAEERRGQPIPTEHRTLHETRSQHCPPKSTQGMIEVTTLVIFHEWNWWWRNIINKKNKKE